jgi:indole-3-glycerol phosphate synthase
LLFEKKPKILEDILKKTREDVKEREKRFSMDWLGKSLAFNPFPPRDVKKFLKSTPENPYRIIAEIKKASPSKGIIREDFEPTVIAQEYEKGGASALSILTEPHFFQGNLDYLGEVRRYSKLPILRKDFIVSKYQILEALVHGADFILLIAKALSRNELKELYEYAIHLGLDVLVEIHDKTDLVKATFSGADIIGINHRNLETFEMDMKLSEKLIPLIPHGKIIVAESGLTENVQLAELNKIGVDAFLIGEHFMRQDNLSDAVKKVRGEI